MAETAEAVTVAVAVAVAVAEAGAETAEAVTVAVAQAVTGEAVAEAVAEMAVAEAVTVAVAETAEAVAEAVSDSGSGSGRDSGGRGSSGRGSRGRQSLPLCRDFQQQTGTVWGIAATSGVVLPSVPSLVAAPAFPPGPCKGTGTGGRGAISSVTGCPTARGGQPSRPTQGARGPHGECGLELPQGSCSPSCPLPASAPRQSPAPVACSHTSCCEHPGAKGQGWFGGAPVGQGAHPLQEAAGHCRAVPRQRQDRGVTLLEMPRCPGWSLLPRAAQCMGRRSCTGQAQPLARHLPLQRSYIPIPRDPAPSFAPGFGQHPAALQGPGAVPAAVGFGAEDGTWGL
ncbi:collagen alpha-1(I) chain-like isoform X2 [Chroicocephalus ridibundus]|uniref:collagen alpha-1(I) chain-like isoform X2 n=1 Tax=Chroicocephalus ridibundus TaxID=1192867 RepID=UPI002FDF02EB